MESPIFFSADDLSFSGKNMDQSGNLGGESNFYFITLCKVKIDTIASSDGINRILKRLDEPQLF